MTHKFTLLIATLLTLFAMPGWAQSSAKATTTYSRINSINDLVVGNTFLILGENNGTYYTIGDQDGNHRSAVEIDADSETVTVSEPGINEFVISGDPINLYTFLNKVGYTSHGFLYAASSDDDQLNSEYILDDNGKWTIAINEETGEATIIAQGENTHNTLRFNSEERLFSCYTSGNQDPVYIYMEDDAMTLDFYSNTIIEDVADDYLFLNVNGDATLTVTGTISENLWTIAVMDGAQLIYDHDVPNGMFAFTYEKYNDEKSGHTDCWHLFCTPINEFEEAVPGIRLTGEFELYSFDEPTLSWIDEASEAEEYYPLTLGQGCLFAMPSSNSHGRFGGMGTLQGSKNDLSFPLSYTEGANELKGFNLVGNPFPCNAYLNMDCLVLDETGSNLIAGDIVKAGFGAFVQAMEAGQEITFSRNAPETTDGFIGIVLTQGEGQPYDNARIYFNEGHRMNKFYLSDNTARIYIPQEGEQLAITSAQPEGEIPVNFKNAENGSYTLNVSTDNLEVEYLHLIDNLTGIDTDLLATPNYTFEAQSNDDIARFKLVFTTTGVEDNNVTASFAYMRGNELFIDNIEGTATLQIIDMMGHTISSENVSGNYSKTLNVAPGIYLINLNGTTQKIVVK